MKEIFQVIDINCASFDIQNNQRTCMIHVFHFKALQ